jgi:glutathione S-transferase
MRQSGAIIQYLVEQYDKNGKISYPDNANKYLTQQWLAFQISGNVLVALTGSELLMKYFQDKAHISGKRHGLPDFTQKSFNLLLIAI